MRGVRAQQSGVNRHLGGYELRCHQVGLGRRLGWGLGCTSCLCDEMEISDGPKCSPDGSDNSLKAIEAPYFVCVMHSRGESPETAHAPGKRMEKE